MTRNRRVRVVEPVAGRRTVDSDRQRADRRETARRSADARTIRIIGGCWRRATLVVPDVPGLRPTGDRVRETLFNWLGQSLHGWRCLDLFAGTGVLGLEAASRGAVPAVLVESSDPILRAIHGALEKLGDRRDPDCQRAARAVRVLGSGADRALAQLAAEQCRFDIVFVDPPFGQAQIGRVLPALVTVLEDGALVYLEAEHEIAPTMLDSWLGPGTDAVFERVRAARAGRVHYHLFRFRHLAGTESTER